MPTGGYGKARNLGVAHIHNGQGKTGKDFRFLCLQQIPNKPTTRFFVKAPIRGAFTKNLDLV